MTMLRATIEGATLSLSQGIQRRDAIAIGRVESRGPLGDTTSDPSNSRC